MRAVTATIVLSFLLLASGCAVASVPTSRGADSAKLAALQKQVDAAKAQVDAYSYIYGEATTSVDAEPAGDVAVASSTSVGAMGRYMGRIQRVYRDGNQTMLAVDFITDGDLPDAARKLPSGQWRHAYGWNRWKHVQAFPLALYSHMLVTTYDSPVHAVSPSELLATWQAHAWLSNMTYYLDFQSGQIDKIWPVPDQRWDQ